MNQEEFFDLLKSSGIPFKYRVWRSPPGLPWGVYKVESDNTFFADGIPYYAAHRYEVELYTERKDLGTEALLSRILRNAGVSFQKSEQYIESEEVYEILYECEV